MKEYGLEDATELISAARNAIELLTKSPSFDANLIKRTIEKDIFRQKASIFLALKHYHTKETRGEMGILFPEVELFSGVIDAAIGAAARDPRFIPLSSKELDNTIIELSIISKPELLKGGEKARISKLKKGRDGIIVEYGVHRGFILPYVIEEHGWTKKQAFEEACTLAKIPKSYWMQPSIKTYRFEAQTFIEEKPNGKVIIAETIKTTST